MEAYMKKTKKICPTALGIALYVALSMTAKIPFVGQISLDLGYIVLAVYCWMFGSVVGGIVGAVGCTLVSLLASGWFPPGWLVANLYIGLFCGWIFGPKNRYRMSCSIFLPNTVSAGMTLHRLGGTHMKRTPVIL